MSYTIEYKPPKTIKRKPNYPPAGVGKIKIPMPPPVGIGYFGFCLNNRGRFRVEGQSYVFNADGVDALADALKEIARNMKEDEDNG